MGGLLGGAEGYVGPPSQIIGGGGGGGLVRSTDQRLTGATKIKLKWPVSAQVLPLKSPKLIKNV